MERADRAPVSADQALVSADQAPVGADQAPVSADRAPASTFYAPGVWTSHAELDEAAAHHAGVKRLKVGDVVRLTSGDGRRVLGTITELARRRLIVALRGDVERVAPPPRVELWAPVGDRERMLLLAEKAVELGASVWRPIVYRRSRSVSPRGEGDAFREKLRLRMVSALEQSGGAWLPSIDAETTLDVALGAFAKLGTSGASAVSGDMSGNAASNVSGNAASNVSGNAASNVSGILMDVDGPPLASLGGVRAPVAIAMGPEGGLDADERDAFLGAGWRPASLGANVLRFETAGIAALAVIRALTG